MSDSSILLVEVISIAPQERVAGMRPRKYLRNLPTRTRPSLFGSD